MKQLMTMITGADMSSLVNAWKDAHEGLKEIGWDG